MISNKTTDTTLRDQHTHHFTMTNARVISDPNYVAANCPTAHFAVAATTTGFVVVGMASTTGNGATRRLHPTAKSPSSWSASPVQMMCRSQISR